MVHDGEVLTDWLNQAIVVPYLKSIAPSHLLVDTRHTPTPQCDGDISYSQTTACAPFSPQSDLCRVRPDRSAHVVMGEE